MKNQSYVRSVEVAAPQDELFAWHERPGAFERLVPPWEHTKLISTSGHLRPGSRTEIAVRLAPLVWKRWLAEHDLYDPPHEFRDVQLSGPFAEWVHRHRFEATGDGASRLLDEVSYRLPMGRLGRFFGSGTARRKLEAMFAYRHAVTAADVVAHYGVSRQRVLVTGASGLVGSALLPFLTTGGHDVSALQRRAETIWDPALATMSADAVVHLAGESIADGRWNDEKKDRILKSRVEGTRRLAETISAWPQKPRVLICASAVGYYGDRGDEPVDETAAPGEGFLADVCRAWEDAAAPARAAGIRVVHMRFGVILSPRGGALQKMLLPFRMGGGGPIGGGKQQMSWIALDDVIGAIHHAMTTESLNGPINTVAPAPVSNREYAKTLGRVLRRPAFLPMPAFAARLAFGEMANELLLAGQRVVPQKLVESGYPFRCPTLEGALRHILGKTIA